MPDPSVGADHHRRRCQHCPKPRRQGGYSPERNRPRTRDGRHRCQGRDPERDGDGDGESAVHHRGSRTLQDGRSRPDNRRSVGRPAGAGQRDQRRGSGHQEHRLARCWPREHFGGSGSRGGQHARQEPVFPRSGRCGGDRARRSRPDHLDQPCQFTFDTPGFLRRRDSGCDSAARVGVCVDR